MTIHNEGTPSRWQKNYPYLALIPDRSYRSNGEINKLYPQDRAAHDWYRFVLSFPPHLVREYLARFSIDERYTVLDPFCGTGTTLVECKKLRIPSIGIEANPMAHFASEVKVDWNPDSEGLAEHANIAAWRVISQTFVQPFARARN